VITEHSVIILAAGEGKRMRSALPKMLHPLLGRTVLGHVLAATEALRAQKTVVVVGHGADQVTDHLARTAPGAIAALQVQQRGTGHAARVGMEAAGWPGGTVVVLNGDVPLLRSETLAAMIAAHEGAGSAATVLTADVADPNGLGRIVRHPGTGEVDAIVEHRDATPEQLEICEINAGVYAFDGALLEQLLGKLTTHNDQGEEYLTDIIGLLVDGGHGVGAFTAEDPIEVLGCNDRIELAGLHALLRDRVNADWMRDGVTIIDPTTTWIDVTATVGRDAVIEPNTHLRGYTQIGSGARIGPDTTLIDVTVGEAAHVLRAHAVQAKIGPRAVVGPYAYLRPGTVLHDKSKVGTFVEVKNSEVGAGTKIPHLSYVGDATIGEESNIGAATVFVNYDGEAKHRTVIGSHARTGADNMFVAPVEIGDGAYTAAGSVITRDVPPGALGVARGQQRNIEGWVERRRPGSAAAQAAAAAHERAGTGPEGPAVPAATETAQPATSQPASAGSAPEGDN
jgi:bifunctional UDP-N-acetylglucosamine pyrophosphorylase/glucosamine-1-phosphate N-acetyltransferase